MTDEMSLDELDRLARWAVTLPFGVGNMHLASLQESWTPFRRFLYACVLEYEPKVVVECGVYRGTCTGHMAWGDKRTIVVGIDREFQPEALTIFEMFSNILPLEGDTVAPNVVNLVANAVTSFGKIGLLFLDSTHDGDTPRKEFEAYRPMFADECIVAVDDLLGPSNQMEVMQKFWRWLPGEKMEMHYLHPAPASHAEIMEWPGFGVSIVRKND